MLQHSPSPPRILRPNSALVDGELRSDVQIELREGRIHAITPREGPIELPGRCLIPGFVNAHSHAFQRGLRGHVQCGRPGDDFWSWRERMYALANGLDPDGIEAVSALAFLEMAKAGFTTVGEFHYLHHDPDGHAYADRDHLARAVIRAARSVGMRICLLRVAYARSGVGRPAERHQRRFVDRSATEVLDAVRRLSAISDPLLTVGLAPHSVRAVPREWLEAFSDYEGPVHAHVSEQPRENMECEAEHGCSPLALLERAGLLSERFHAVHMTWPQAGDPQRLRDSGAGVVACPTTELDLGDGLLPLDHLEGVPLAIGTDSHAQIEPLAELRALELHARAAQGRRCVLESSEDPDALALRLLGIGSGGGCHALGLDGGRIEPGAPADLVGIDLEALSLVGARPLPGVVFSAPPSVVQDVWVAGERVVSGGTHAREREIRERAVRALRSI